MGCFGSKTSLLKPSPLISTSSKDSHRRQMKARLETIPRTTANIPEEVFALHAIFSKYDRDRLGYLSVESLSSMLIECMWDGTQIPGSINTKELPSQNDIENVMKFLDRDGNMRLDRQEFVEWINNGFKKSQFDLQKFCKKGRVQTLLVHFLEAMKVQRDLYLTGLNNFFLDADLISENKIWEQIAVNTRGRNFAMVENQDQLKLCDVLTISNHIESATVSTNMSISRQAVVDFLVHGYVAKERMSDRQKQFHARISGILLQLMQEAKQSFAYAAGNPFVVLGLSLVFQDYDADNDNVINLKEFRKIFMPNDSTKRDKKTGEHYMSVTQIYEKIDANGDGLIDKEEFLNYVVPVLISVKDASKQSTKKNLIHSTLRHRVDLKVSNLQKQHATLTRIFRRSARHDGCCSDLQLSNLLKICHRRAPRPAPVVTKNSVRALIKEFFSNDEAAVNSVVPEKLFVGQSLILINMPPAALDTIAEVSHIKGMAIQMVRLIISECKNIQKETQSSAVDGKIAAEELYLNRKHISKQRYGSDTESDDLSSEDEHRNISRANKSGHNTIEKNFGWDKL